MTEEENEAIETLQYLCSDDCISKDIIKTIVNLIEKLKKENEELKNKVAKRNNELIELDETSEKEFLTKQEVKENYIPKDKVRDKLDEIMSYTFTSIEERHQQNYAYDRIRELLEEVKR